MNDTIQAIVLRAKKDPIKTLITLVVAFLHTAFIAAMIMSPSLLSPKKETKLVVKTFTAAPPSKVIEKKQPPALKKTLAPPVKVAPAAPTKIEKPMPKPKPTEAKPVPQKSAAPTKAKVETKAPSPKSKEKLVEEKEEKVAPFIPDDLLTELQNKIAKLDQTPSSSKSPQAKIAEKAPAIPAQITFSDVTEQFFDTDSSYTEILISFLHQNLHLPDFGEVKMQITIGTDGLVKKCIVLSAESEKNKKYLQERLTQLRFPSLSNTKKEDKEQSLTLTFCHDI